MLFRSRDAAYFWALPAMPATSIADTPAEPHVSTPPGIAPAYTPVDAPAVPILPESPMPQTLGSAVSTPLETTADTPVDAPAVSTPPESPMAQTPVNASAVSTRPGSQMAQTPAMPSPVSTPARARTAETPDKPSPGLPSWKAPEVAPLRPDHRRSSNPAGLGLQSDRNRKAPSRLIPVPAEWVEGVRRLQERSRPSAIPLHLWKLFVGDCREFMKTWAQTAANLGWDTSSLFGSRYESPHEHLGSAGLLWHLKGGQIERLGKDAANFKGGDGKPHDFLKRRDWSTITLPWDWP